MKKLLRLLPFLFAAASLFSACSDDENVDLYPSELTKGAYIVNYGGYGAGTSSITKYDYEADETTEYYYQVQNNLAKIISSPQYAYYYQDRIYLMNNEPDNVIVTDPLFVAQDTITTDVVKPRACVAYGDYLYISCWGPNPNWIDLPNSYILKYNVVTRTVERKISLPGGPEGVEIANGKLYAALNFKKAVAVMDLSTEAISYLETPETCSYLLKDKDNNLYVSLISYAPSDQTGLGYINTSTNQLIIYSMEGVSPSYSSIMAFNKDKSKLYVVGAEGYPPVGGVKIFDTATKSFLALPLVDNLTGINGVSVNPKTDDIYVFVSNGGTTKGIMKIYGADRAFKKDVTVGAAPAMAISLD